MYVVPTVVIVESSTIQPGGYEAKTEQGLQGVTVARYITLTDHDDHGQGNSPLILDAELVVAMSEFDRGRTSAGTHIASGKAGTRIVVATPYGNVARSFYVQETIYIVASRIYDTHPAAGSVGAGEDGTVTP